MIYQFNAPQYEYGEPLEPDQEEAGVRMLFNIVDPTGLIGSSSVSEIALNGIAKIIGDSLSTAEDLPK